MTPFTPATLQTSDGSKAALAIAFAVTFVPQKASATEAELRHCHGSSVCC
jgi:hypothetical protein